MINVNIDNLGKSQAASLFEQMSGKKYVFRIDCSLDSTSSVSITATDGAALFKDLEKFYEYR
jgi:hypothetical protein